MSVSPFFKHLRTSYQAEMDDLTSDSEGKDVLKKRLAEKRKEISFLTQMIELSPEMVAVIFHSAFNFKLPAVMDDLLTFESEELPDWETLADVVLLADWAQEPARAILKEPRGEWFMTVAAALEYMYSKPDTRAAAQADDDSEDGDEEDNEDDDRNVFDDEEEEAEARAREEAGADWMVEQGFDRKD